VKHLSRNGDSREIRGPAGGNRRRDHFMGPTWEELDARDRVGGAGGALIPDGDDKQVSHEICKTESLEPVGGRVMDMPRPRVLLIDDSRTAQVTKANATVERSTSLLEGSQRRVFICSVCSQTLRPTETPFSITGECRFTFAACLSRSSGTGRQAGRGAEPTSRDQARRAAGIRLARALNSRPLPRGHSADAGRIRGPAEKTCPDEQICWPGPRAAPPGWP